ncbi:MAG: hypothetical protein IJA59_04280 [Clostridia bacterium]|nr:hypothetical protein [Clostridia bacterium]
MQKMTRIKRNTAIISIAFDSLIAVKHRAYLGAGQGELLRLKKEKQPEITG